MSFLRLATQVVVVSGLKGKSPFVGHYCAFVLMTSQRLPEESKSSVVLPHSCSEQRSIVRQQRMLGVVERVPK